ncbi:hypothetical protein N7474_008172 [Penicillium riverlandense]|uniref:uncharacterized protein n=1 Tax=Penicillium riverlandense TaxID=1903569 RepID=UPI00254733FD|nr:uncharacterized protein N7474_008172 [Penicillium riverlandense]KAJ5811871.1 hypothetical protein N7474_008172 [Penicillium riverlandense]
MANIHHGDTIEIPASSSPGLRFLQSLLPLLDSLNTIDIAKLDEFICPTARFTVNGVLIGKLAEIKTMFLMRAQNLAYFGHEVDVTWDIQASEGSKNHRTIMYESTSVSIFKADSEKEEIRVREFNIIELEEQEEGLWKAVELRTFMDPSAVSEKARTVSGI